MSTRLANWLLKALALLFLGIAVGSLIWEVQAYRVELTNLTGHPPLQRTPARFAEAPPLDQFAASWHRELQGRSVDLEAEPEPEPDAEDQQVTNVAIKRIRIKLVGTILETGRSKAIFVGPDGKIDLKGVGQNLELTPKGVRVEHIELASVTLSFQGETLTLPLASAEGRP